MRHFLPLLLIVIQQYILPAQNQTISYDDGALHFEVYGDGPPFLIINGGPGMSSEGFRTLASSIAKMGYQTIIYDQRGTGQSALNRIDSTTVTIDNMIIDIELLRSFLKIKEWIVMGHSFGGMLASKYASIYPDCVKALILSSSGGVNLDLLSSLDITGRLSQNERDSLRFWNLRISEGDTSYYAALQRGKYLAPAYLYDKSHVATVARRLTQGNRNINGLVFQDMIATGFDCSVGLKTYEKPVLILQGQYDIIDKRISEYAHQMMKGSELFILPDCSHYGWLDQPELYFLKIQTFLNNVNWIN